MNAYSFIRQFIFVLLVSISFFALLPAHATDIKDDIIGQVTASGEKGEFKSDAAPQQIIAEIIQVGLGVVGTLFISLIVYGGYLRFTSLGESDRVEKSTSVIQRAVIGLVVTLMAYGITLFIAQRAYNTAIDRPGYDTSRGQPSFFSPF